MYCWNRCYNPDAFSRSKAFSCGIKQIPSSQGIHCCVAKHLSGVLLAYPWLCSQHSHILPAFPILMFELRDAHCKMNAFQTHTPNYISDKLYLFLLLKKKVYYYFLNEFLEAVKFFSVELQIHFQFKENSMFKVCAAKHLCTNKLLISTSVFVSLPHA